MSGIIGGAGSKSGVIGQTELDYEEGEVTNALTINTTQQTAYSSGRSNIQYTKIGKIVHLQCYLDTDGQTLGTTGTVKVSLPFAVSGGSATAFITGVASVYLFLEATAYQVALNFDEDSSLLNFTWLKADASSVYHSGSPNVSNTAHRIIVRLACSYQTDS